MMSTRTLWAIVMTLLLAASASGQQVEGLSPVEVQTQQIASELRCPVCQGTSINDSPSELAQQMKDIIRERLEAGQTPEEVKAYFVDKYGEWVLLRPEARGFNLVVYVMPVLALLGGALIVYSVVRKWTVADALPIDDDDGEAGERDVVLNAGAASD